VRSIWTRIGRLVPLVSLPLLAGALAVVHRELAAHHPRDILLAIQALSPQALGAALLLTVIGYAFLPSYDALGLRYVGHPLGARRTLLAGFLAYGFSQTLGFSLFTGGSLRYRLYSSWGLTGTEIAGVIAVSAVAFWLGAATLSGLAFVAFPEQSLGTIGLSPFAARALGTVLLAFVTAYLWFGLTRRQPLRIGGWVLPPVGRLAALQIAAGLVDWVLATAVIYALLPSTLRVGFIPLAGIFVIAQVVGLASHVPGGLGVFESVVLLLLRGQGTPPSLVGSLVVYRVVYYILPFTAAALTLATYELRQRRDAVARAAHAAAQWLPALAPRVAAAVTFLAGTVLLFSGSLPAEGGRLEVLRDIVPLPVLEASHFLGSIIGVALLLLARGLANRLDAAYHVAVALLGAAIATSLLKGIDYEEAIVSGLALLALRAARSHFDRRASLLHEPWSTGWTVAVGTVLMTALWLGLFAFRHVPYRDELWWRFAFDADAPRFLRATVGAFVAAGVWGVARLARPAAPSRARPDHDELADAATVIAASPETYGNLALLGDKSLFFDSTRSSFIMYQVSGRSWIAMGDPVGPDDAAPDMVWLYREMVEHAGGLTVFYQVPPRSLPIYLDLGLRPLKLGEEGRVPLDGWSLEGGDRRGLRRVKKRMESDGCSFALLPPDDVARAMDQLRDVSDAWLQEKKTREKGFSLGRFDPGYLARYPAGVVRVQGNIVAFANLWLGANQEEISNDLMRYTPGAPPGVMEYLFIELMLWGAQQGYRWYNLGMAPLSGMEVRAFAPLWNRLNALVYRHGEHFYNFQGLRQYKEKFHPVWTPRYLVSPGGLALPRVLGDLAALISGGLSGVVTR
jgi:phosphatidylglycerol lysyltransferase